MTDWHEHQACIDSDIAVFFPPAGFEALSEARSLCRRCPVRQQCLNEALKLNDTFGFRGGKTGEERRKILKEQPGPDVLAKIRRLKGKGWSKSAICLALGVSDYPVDRAGPATPREAA